MSITGETNKISRITVQSWIECLLELTAAHEFKNIRDVNENLKVVKSLDNVLYSIFYRNQ